MLSEKSPALENASKRIHLSLTEFKTIPDDTLPLYTDDSRVSDRQLPNPWKRIFLAFTSVCLFLVLVHSNPLSCLSPTRPPAVTRNPAYLITAEHGAVAAENKRCSDIGVHVLKDGGNAVDAAIAASLCTGVVNMFS